MKGITNASDLFPKFRGYLTNGETYHPGDVFVKDNNISLVANRTYCLVREQFHYAGQTLTSRYYAEITIPVASEIPTTGSAVADRYKQIPVLSGSTENYMNAVWTDISKICFDAYLNELQVNGKAVKDNYQGIFDKTRIYQPGEMVQWKEPTYPDGLENYRYFIAKRVTDSLEDVGDEELWTYRLRNAGFAQVPDYVDIIIYNNNSDVDYVPLLGRIGHTAFYMASNGNYPVIKKSGLIQANGGITVPTMTDGDNSTNAASTAFVQNIVGNINSILDNINGEVI